MKILVFAFLMPCQCSFKNISVLFIQTDAAKTERLVCWEHSVKRHRKIRAMRRRHFWLRFFVPSLHCHIKWCPGTKRIHMSTTRMLTQTWMLIVRYFIRNVMIAYGRLIFVSKKSLLIEIKLKPELNFLVWFP